MPTRHCSAILAAIMTMTAATADLKLPNIIDDHMVLQRESTAPLWGWAKPGATLTVTPSWSTAAAKATAAAAGAWRVDLKTPTAGGPYEIKITGDGERVLKDVLIGEVWVCSGQSNMEWPLHNTEQGDQFIAAAKQPQIRLFDLPRTAAPGPQTDVEGTWTACTPESVREFTAVGYHFGRVLHEKLDVPIGLISSNWGGTPAESWTSAAGLRPFDAFAERLEQLAQEAALGDDRERVMRQRLEEWWHALEELDDKHGGRHAMQPEFDDSQWEAAVLPGPWEKSNLPGYDGVAWYRRTFELPATADAAATDWRLLLGPIDDMDEVWLNGRKIAETQVSGFWFRPRDYPVPTDVLKPGRNSIAVRVLDFSGPGGFCGNAEQLKLQRGEDEAGAVTLAGTWKLQPTVKHAQLPPGPPSLDLHPHTPSVLYNAMIAPLVPFGVRGAIWYQGESNVPRAKQYQKLFPAMIADWRRAWERDDLAFYFVQIAPFRYAPDHGEAAELREAQLMTMQTVPLSGMAVTMDIGNTVDIHPRNKRDVGDRLARWALHDIHGFTDIVPSGPVYKSMEVREGRAVLSFDYAHGLRGPAGGGKLQHFTIAGADQEFLPAEARIVGDTVVVWSSEVADPVAVRYCWGATDEGTLFNAAGLPASSFRTDDWSRE